MDENEEPMTLVVVEPSRILMATRLDLDAVTTMIALISDDPASWDEALSAWPRYRTPAANERFNPRSLSEVVGCHIRLR